MFLGSHISIVTLNLSVCLSVGHLYLCLSVCVYMYQWTEYLVDLPTLLRHCISEVFSLGGLIWMFRLRVLLCCLFAVLYLVSPLDILPEAIFGLFGLLDDIFVVLLITIYISVIYRRLVAARAEAAANDNQ